MTLCIFTVTNGIDCDTLLVSFLPRRQRLRVALMLIASLLRIHALPRSAAGEVNELVSLSGSCFHTENAPDILRSTGKAPDTGSVRIEQLGRHLL